MKLLTKRKERRIIHALTQLQMAVIKDEYIMSNATVGTLTAGIRDIVKMIGGAEGTGQYAEVVLDHCFDADWSPDHKVIHGDFNAEKSAAK